jgi:paraquat-inducible protein B
MSRRANPTWVGAFVLGALALAVVAVAVFGSGRLFRETHPFVLYFTGSVNGLDPGAPVKFKGVEVGSVQRIMVRFERTAGEVSIPVFIELDAEKLARAGAQVEFTPEAMQTAIEQGLRGRLESQSLVTGLLFVNLDYYPETPVRRVGAADGWPPEIPTLPTTIEQATQVVKDIVERLGQIDLEALVSSATGTLEALRELAGSPEARGALASLDETLASLRELSRRLDQTIGPLGESLRSTAQETQRLEEQLSRTLGAVQQIVQPGSPLTQQLATALQDVSAAARSVRALADSLERNPGAIVRGRSVEGRRP